MASNTFDINLVVLKIILILLFLYRFQIYVCHVSSAVSKFVFVYHISSTLDDSRRRYAGISIFKMLTSAILDFRN